MAFGQAHVVPAMGTPERVQAAATASATGNGRPMPATLRVPVHVTPGVQLNTNIGVDSNPVLTFGTVSVAVSDVEANSLTAPQNPADVAAAHAQHAAGQSGHVLLTATPHTSQRDPTGYYTTFNFYATDRSQIEGLAIEHAYDVYATGAGNVLGDYRIVSSQPGTNATTGNTTIRYLWQGDATISPGLTAGQFVNLHGVTLNSSLASTYVTYLNYLEGDQSTWAADAAAGILTTLAPRLAPAQLAVVKQKAEDLLLATLTDAQRKTWLADNYVLVVTPTGRTYRVERGCSMNVYLTDPTGQNKVRQYCAYASDPGGSLPAADQVFAQLVTLRYNEREYLAQIGRAHV